MTHTAQQQLIRVPAGTAQLEGMLVIPDGAPGVVLFAHGSGSSRHSPRNNYVAGKLHEAGLATLLIDLLTEQEDRDYETRFDIALLTRRLQCATEWLQTDPRTRQLRIGYFGASTGAAAALQSAAALGSAIAAVVSRGGRPDLAGAQHLARVKSPTLLIVGGHDDVVIELNQQAYDLLQCDKELVIVPGATHLFEEPGTLDQAAQHACAWFGRHLNA
ncbi:MAG: dienelactone hydrolase family protein [Gammaproteobacteria bacterium]|nr:dienelactone hydrolase family protein [Gammaproteobacteria bacterium]